MRPPGQDTVVTGLVGVVDRSCWIKWTVGVTSRPFQDAAMEAGSESTHAAVAVKLVSLANLHPNPFRVSTLQLSRISV